MHKPKQTTQLIEEEKKRVIKIQTIKESNPGVYPSARIKECRKVIDIDKYLLYFN